MVSCEASKPVSQAHRIHLSPTRFEKKQGKMEFGSHNRLKTTYKVQSSLENLYTGGKLAISKDGSFAAACCNEEIKLIELSTGKLTSTLAGVV
jgi:hypothetical protein